MSSSLTSPTTPWFWGAISSSAVAAALSLFHIAKHLSVYNEPVLQRHTCRIIFMVVVGSITSLLAMVFSRHAIYMLTIRDCYDSFVIYNFVALCIALAGGPGAIVSQSEHVVVRHCCLPPQQVDGNFLRRCKQGTLQFVILKPVLAALSLVLFAVGLLDIGNFSPTNGFVYMAVALNATYTVALFFLLQFYLGTRELLAEYRPGVKFLLIKAVIFVTFWQGIALAVLLRTHTIGQQEDAEYIQNLLVCMEMSGAALLMLVAFPWSEYSTSHTKSPAWAPSSTPTSVASLGAAPAAALPFRQALAHVLTISDVAQDVVHQFSNDYASYVLHNNALDPILAKQKKEDQRHLQQGSSGGSVRGGTSGAGVALFGRASAGGAAGVELSSKPPRGKSKSKKGGRSGTMDRAGLLSAGPDSSSDSDFDLEQPSNRGLSGTGGGAWAIRGSPTVAGGLPVSSHALAPGSLPALPAEPFGQDGVGAGGAWQRSQPPPPQQQQQLFTLGSGESEEDGAGGGWEDAWLDDTTRAGDSAQPASRGASGALPQGRDLAASGGSGDYGVLSGVSAPQASGRRAPEGRRSPKHAH